MCCVLDSKLVTVCQQIVPHRGKIGWIIVMRLVVTGSWTVWQWTLISLYMLWRGGCCVGGATCSIFWCGDFTVKSSPHCLIMKTYCRFFGTNAFKVPCWKELQELLVEWGDDWADNLKIQIQGRCGYRILTREGSMLPGLNWYGEFVYLLYFLSLRIQCEPRNVRLLLSSGSARKAPAS